jgi:hypothetical protein
VIEIRIEASGIQGAEDRIRALHRGIPWFLRYVGRQIALTAKRQAVANASNADLRRRTGHLVHWTNDQQPTYGEHDVSWGLPKGNKESMIGRALNDGVRNITSRSGKFLRIPIPGGPADQGAGVDPYSGVPLRSIGGFFVSKSKAGNPIIFRIGGGKAERGAMFTVTPWYLLRASVTIPPHPWFSNAVMTTESVVPAIIESRLHALEQQAASNEEAP